MDDYKVTYSDGSEQFYQYDEDDPGLTILKEAAKDKSSDVESIAKAKPEPFNKEAKG